MSYDKLLVSLAEWQAEWAEQAKGTQDERNRSILLMKANMCQGMLPALLKNEGAADRVLAQLKERSERFRAKADFDSADRTQIQIALIERAREVMKSE